MSAIRTAENKSHDLGTANKRFKDLYVGGINADGAITATSLTINGNSVAAVDNTDLSTLQNPSTEIAPSQQSTKSYVDSQVAAVIDAAPDALNTLNELAAALNDDAGLGATVTANATKLANIENNATADQTGAEIKALYEAENDTNAFTDAQVTKLAGIEAGATADQTGAEIKALYEAENDTNAFTDALKTKLDGIEANATADQTGAEIKALYEAENDTNAFTDALKTKLDGIEANATADQTKADIDALNIDAASVSGFTVGVSVPADAVFTDTTYAVQDGELSQNNFTNDLKTKLDGIEANATADQTKADIDGLGINAASVSGFTVGVNVPADAVFTDTTYAVQDGELSQNNFTDALKAKLDGIESSADVTDATNVAAAGAVMSTDADASGYSFVIDEDTLASDSDTKVPTQQSVKTYVDTQVSNIIGGAPAALDTLNELAAALGNDSSFATSVTNSLSGKASTTTQVIAGSGLSGGGTLAADRTLAVSGLTLTHFADAAVQTSAEAFADVDTAIMTAAAVADKIESYGYTTAASLNLDNYMPVAGGTFSGAVQVNGTLTIKGDLIQIDNGIGDPDSVSFHDANIVIDADNSGNDVADGAGITIEGGSGDDITFQWNATDSRMELKQGDSYTDLRVGAITSTGGAIQAVASEAEKLDHDVTFSLTGAVTTTANVATDFNETTGSTVTLNTAIADGSVAPAKLSAAVPVSLGGTGATTAAAARTALGVDAAGTDNSTNVTLANTNYLSINGQEITGGTVPVSSGGTGATDAATARTNLGVDAAGTDNSTDVTLEAVDNNYLSINGQAITAGTVPVSLGGTGATTAAAARTALGVDAAGTDNSTNVTLSNTNYLSINGQEITGGTVPVSSGGTGATTAADARTALGVDAAGTDNSTNVTLANTNYLSINGQEITGGTIPITSGGTGATTAAAARTALGVDAAGTDNSTNVTLANTNYLSITGQEITGGTIPVSSGGTGATTAADARTALGVDAAGTDNSTDVTLSNTNYLSINGQEITGGTVPVTSGGTGATSVSAARTALEVITFPDADRGSAWITTTSGSDTLVTMGTEVDGHSGSWKIISRLETTAADGNITSVSLVADYQVRPSSRINKLKSLPDTLWNIPEDGVLQLR